MKRTTSYLLIFLALAALTSCNNNGFKKTKSGLLYKIIPDGKGDVAKKGQFIKFNFTQKVHDSVLVSTDTLPLPAYMKVDSVGPIYSAVEIFTMLRKGDSAVIVQLADSIEKKYHQPLPPYIHKKDKLLLSIKVLDIFSADSLVIKDREALIDVEKKKEIAAIEDYFKKNNITGALQTAKGNFYLISTHGNGPKADSGKKVSVNYTGYDLSGKFFDSNMDSTKQSQKHPLIPFDVVIGRGGAVPGMMDVMEQFREGDKGRIFIPGANGYGQQGNPPVIKPFENLVFDIEIDSVRNAPPAPPRRMFNPKMQMNRGQLQAPHK
ncbi:MAG TPA: FKBP-type peptidyl-prolyl cis-trans isomerase [Puia sp.]|jgi:FKBP-type peptidyl-prolyl cis-trans isomerase|nr:FKBP-type peptidyl-prolyl cis-trans isomerase [Puia sp.]